MSHIWTEEELKIKNKSCDTCKHVHKVVYHLPESWKCEAPENKTPAIDKVSGLLIGKYSSCVSVRYNWSICTWHQPLFIYNRFGIADYSLGRQAANLSIPNLRINLKNTTVDDL